MDDKPLTATAIREAMERWEQGPAVRAFEAAREAVLAPLIERLRAILARHSP